MFGIIIDIKVISKILYIKIFISQIKLAYIYMHIFATILRDLLLGSTE